MSGLTVFSADFAKIIRAAQDDTPTIDPQPPLLAQVGCAIRRGKEPGTTAFWYDEPLQKDAAATADLEKEHREKAAGTGDDDLSKPDSSEPPSRIGGDRSHFEAQFQAWFRAKPGARGPFSATWIAMMMNEGAGVD